MLDSWYENLLVSLLIVAVAFVARVVLGYVIRRSVRTIARRSEQRTGLSGKTAVILAKAGGADPERQARRVSTIGSLLRNVVNVVIVTVSVLTILSVWGVPMGPLIASAGVGGVALGFGAQSLVKDYLSGVFMLSEDQFGVGDMIQVGDLKGTVKEVTLRVTKLEDPSGAIWYVRNGEVLTLGNLTQGFSSTVVDIPVAIDEDPDRVRQVLSEAIAPIATEKAWKDVLMAPPEVLGVGSLQGGTMTMQVLLKTKANQQWGPMREVREYASEAFTAHGIRPPLITRIE
ncbi:mechanosensitive ion channel family protein [Tessaracoccus caeni]|uniref:mechanosensitive ion channel family protein n=1 Tax=Tessaracoccus caeni TaxID=3031239 RepID=UPI0023DBB144|nr:mechanosensitive ion channel family protein [Tessaracoccus caeni]MDF1487502.1 mechanosensitive ion channel family protein [Tessaracoccus caeni]